MTIVKLLCFELDVILTEPRLNWTTNLDAGLDELHAHKER